MPILSRGMVREALPDGHDPAPNRVFLGVQQAWPWPSRGQVVGSGLATVRPAGEPATRYPGIAARKIAGPLIVLDWSGI